MNMIFRSLFVLLCATALQTHAFGGGGFDHGNGGDMCENRFKTVRDDLNIWIVKGGSTGLRLPTKISPEKYSHDMLEKIQSAKVSCIDGQVFTGSTEKTCKNFVEADGSLSIQCNTNRFMTTSESDQYILVHHEYAGLAGFEVNTGEGSNYEISNQISGYLENQVIKKLVIKPPASASADPFDPAGCVGPQMSIQDAVVLIPPGATGTVQFATFNIYTRVRRCNNLTGCEKWRVIGNEIEFFKGANLSESEAIPNNGRANFVLYEKGLGVEFVTDTHPISGYGIYLSCGGVGGPAGGCAIRELPEHGPIGAAYGTIAAHCARLTYVRKSFIAEPTTWEEQESAFVSRY